MQLGVAPHIMSVGRSHIVAAVGLGLLAAVLWVVSGIFAARDAVEQEVRDREQRLAAQASTDSLTQLSNRAAFSQALERVVRRRALR